MQIQVAQTEVTYTITVTQQELDVMETVLAQTSGLAGQGNRLAAKLEDFRTERRPYTVKVDGKEYCSRNCTGIHFERVYPDEDTI